MFFTCAKGRYDSKDSNISFIKTKHEFAKLLDAFIERAVQYMNIGTPEDWDICLFVPDGEGGLLYEKSKSIESEDFERIFSGVQEGLDLCIECMQKGSNFCVSY